MITIVTIELIEDDCIGCQACSQVCPDNWGFDENKNKAVLKNGSPTEVGCNKEAADGCPVSCIKVTE